MAVFRKTDNGHVVFECLGCDERHYVPVEGERAWGFNGDMEKPTLTPSILITYPANPEAEEEFKEWRTERKCHSFVRDGMIQYLTDCTHHLAGQTVALPTIKFD